MEIKLPSIPFAFVFYFFKKISSAAENVRMENHDSLYPSLFFCLVAINVNWKTCKIDNGGVRFLMNLSCWVNEMLFKTMFIFLAKEAI